MNVLKSHTVETEWVGAITKNIVVVATAWCPWSYINKWTKGKVVCLRDERQMYGQEGEMKQWLKQRMQLVLFMYVCMYFLFIL